VDDHLRLIAARAGRRGVEACELGSPQLAAPHPDPPLAAGRQAAGIRLERRPEPVPGQVLDDRLVRRQDGERRETEHRPEEQAERRRSETDPAGQAPERTAHAERGNHHQHEDHGTRTDHHGGGSRSPSVPRDRHGDRGQQPQDREPRDREEERHQEHEQH
jgi:hypothetical protein